jgi:hypothetical protein
LLPFSLIQFSNPPLTSFLNLLFLSFLLYSSSWAANENATRTSFLSACSELMKTVRSEEAIRYYRELSLIGEAASLWSTCRGLKSYYSLS